MTIKKWLLVFCSILLVNGCGPLRDPIIVKNAPIEMYKYAYIAPTIELLFLIIMTYALKMNYMVRQLLKALILEM